MRKVVMVGALHEVRARSAELHRLILAAHQQGKVMLDPDDQPDLLDAINVPYHVRQPDFSPQYVAKMHDFYPQPRNRAERRLQKKGKWP